ncbi:homocysteine S-methyltransferase family protein [Butyrivibrio sp. MC2013]|uniref:homocysteine S-methyltransferase family protein n=1 Tax=Butyrivibrio sp. MC2013 TaxID=1280686 RepID=UPI000406AFEE|nr:homocysteine S-methyltransferase family protein [Butyrivibrio sp. MC2013]
MAVKTLKELLSSGRPVFLDGATGTNLMKAGMPAGVCPEKWILEHPDVMKELQAGYAAAGSDIVYAPTFTCSRIKLAEYGLEDKLYEMNRSLVELTREAVGDKCLVAGDLTMTGRQLKPVGDLDFEELIDVYKEQIRALDDAGVDLLVVETMMSLQECRAALIAAGEVSELPVIVTLTFETDGRTLYGTEAGCAAAVMEAMGAAAVGANCSSGPSQMVSVIREMASSCSIPIIAKPNAGMPQIVDGQTVYKMTPEEFCSEFEDIIRAGASVLGGCCGSATAYIKALSDKYRDLDTKAIVVSNDDETCRIDPACRVLTSSRSILKFKDGDPFMIVGERINPTGKKALQAELREGSMDLVCDFAARQEEDGAAILDVNVGCSGIDEKEIMLKAIDELTQISDLPLCIDSSNPEVIEAALRIYPGRALINSISLEEGKAEKLLPLAKKYGAMFVLLPVGVNGIPQTVEEKIDNIRELADKAYEYGLKINDIVVDGLVATVGADPEAAIKMLDTISWCSENGFATICGLSNISFGLPLRSFVNTAFLTMAIDRGLTMAIANPGQEMLVNAAFASDLLKMRDGADIRYIERMQRYIGEDGKPYKFGMIRPGSDQTAPGKDKRTLVRSGDGTDVSRPLDPKEDAAAQLKKDLMSGNKRKIEANTRIALDAGLKPEEILNDILMAGINEVGKKFDKGEYFLPQLIGSAEAMKLSIAVLEPLLKAEGAGGPSKGTIVFATVHGDVHDIGKNLVVLMLKNCGYEVYDMGKDVETEAIIDKALEVDADVIGLSALMTTTMTEMKNVIKLANERNCKARIVIGGACVTQEYADEIGADGYSADAADCVRLIDNMLGNAS